MYVWFRLARMIATAKRRGPYRMSEASRLSFRCLPSDIDPNMHMNNARYLVIADVGRIDLFIRSRLWDLRRERGWQPLMGGVQTAFTREIRLWKRFDLVSSFETWEGREILGLHRFVLEGGETAAVTMTTAGVYDSRNRRFVEIDDVVAALGAKVERRPPTQAQRAFMTSHAALRGLAKGEPMPSGNLFPLVSSGQE
jgi:acyl-CoA thioesterase FadM